LPNPFPPTAAKSPRLGRGHIVVLIALMAILVLTIVWAAMAWKEGDGVAMDKHGWIALGLGTFFSIVIGCGLMALMFFSSRSGHDEAATPKLLRDGRNRNPVYEPVAGPIDHPGTTSRAVGETAGDGKLVDEKRQQGQPAPAEGVDARAPFETLKHLT
jgi:hypothetical protein